MNTKLLFATISIIITIAGCSSSEKMSSQSQKPITNTDSLLKYQHEITSEFLKSHLTAFSADSMEGRETGTKGEKKAARYLAQQYRKFGLQPVGDDSTYFQNFNLNAGRPDSMVFKTFSRNDGNKTLISRSVASKDSKANYLQQFGRGDSLNAEIVFAGFGLQNKDMGISQLQGVDVQGKWVMIFRDAPKKINGEKLYQNKQRFVRKNVSNIIQKGASGVLMIPDKSVEEFNEKAESANSSFGEIGNMSLAYRSQDSQRRALSLNMVRPSKAANLLNIDGIEGLEKKKEEVIDNMKSFKANETAYGLSQISYESEISLETKNVLTFIEGADPKLKNEVVVVSAHYDHLGISQPDSTGDRIYNGADDDVSGTIALVNIAKTFAQAAQNGIKPKRSVLILNVTGEEKGLLGSRYYSDHPVFPADSTVANINTDMIGRIDAKHKKEGEEDYSYIIGSDLISSQLDSLMHVANKNAGQIALSERYNNLQDPNQFYRRSDHWNFGRLGIPFVFFFTGVHEDYHQPSDEVQKIRFDKMTKIARTIYATTVMVANTDKAPEVDNQKFINATKVGN